jgi:hypothetical protein
MTTQELINKLSTFNPDSTVLVAIQTNMNERYGEHPCHVLTESLIDDCDQMIPNATVIVLA